MLQIRIHGRGGQGVVSASEMIAIAAFEEGKYSQSFPSFGSERMGAPVQAFARISSKEITLREPVTEPDLLIIQDPTLLHSINVFEGFKPGGYLLINTSKTVDELGIGDYVKDFPPNHVITMPATDLAMKYIKQPKPNTILLGGVAALSDYIGIEALLNAIRRKFPPKVAEPNITATTAGFKLVQEKLKEAA